MSVPILLAWENSRCFSTPPWLVFPRNDVWETRAEIPYWWRVTTHIWVVMRHQYGLISALVFQTSFRGETVLLAWRNVCFLRLLQLLLFHPVRINSRRPWNLDSWPWILDSRYWIPVFQSWIPDFLSCIPDSKVQDFWFYKQKFPGLRNPDSLTRAYLLFYGVK